MLLSLLLVSTYVSWVGPVCPASSFLKSNFLLFSDIVGFTTISSSMEPHKVSSMLHRLFLKMDALADAHELYKVETIGDAWFGCTNCVQKQDTDHAKRIAEFSLQAMKAANETLIDLDDPSQGHVQIRVGFHSGPVYTNVIDRKSVV